VKREIKFYKTKEGIPVDEIELCNKRVADQIAKGIRYE